MDKHTVGQGNRRMLLFVVTLNLAALACLAFLFIEIKSKNEHISSLVNEIEVEATAEDVQHSVKALIAETSNLRTRLQRFMVGKEEAVSFIEMLENEARGTGTEVTIDSVTPSSLDQSNVESLTLVLKVTGSWAQVVHYLGLLELLPIQSTITQVVVSAVPQESGKQWRIDMTLTVLKEKAV